MNPASFDYFRAASVEEAVALLHRHDDAKVLADVDHRSRLGEAQLHDRQQAVAAGQHLGLLVTVEQRHRFFDAGGPEVVELRWIHG